MISKPMNLINAKLEEIHDDTMFWFIQPSKRSYLMQKKLLSNFSADSVDKCRAF